jgi:uncharacterized membrane protein required for colicin V production
MSSNQVRAQRNWMRFACRLLPCLLIFGSALVLALRGDWITTAILIASATAAFVGFRSGGVSILFFLGAATLAFYVAPSVGMKHELQLTLWFGTTGLTNRFISVAVVAVAILGLSSVLAIVVGRRISKRPRLDAANRWLGFALGGMEGAVAIVLLLGGILMVESRERQRAPLRDPDDKRGQMVSKFILQTSDKARQGWVGPAIVAHNPFETIPQLHAFNELQETVETLKDPDNLQRVLEHPSIRQLERSPEVPRAIDEFRSDPAVADIFQAGQVDGAMVMTLMNHPALLRLIDQPKFMELASQAIQELSAAQLTTDN